MTDFTRSPVLEPVNACIHSSHPAVSTCNQGVVQVINYAAAAWPAANRAIYIPFFLSKATTARQMFWENGGVSGTTDVGIYDITGTRLVSLTATANAGSIQTGNITDTVLQPGAYYMGMISSTVTTQTYWSAAVAIPTLRACGVQQQAVGSATLPATATFAAVASAYLPFVGISFQATM